MAPIERKVCSIDIFVNILRIQTLKIEQTVLNFCYRVLKLSSTTRCVVEHTIKLEKSYFV